VRQSFCLTILSLNLSVSPLVVDFSKVNSKSFAKFDEESDDKEEENQYLNPDIC